MFKGQRTQRIGVHLPKKEVELDMLPDYPRTKAKINDWIAEFMASHSDAAMGPFSDMRTKRHFEGHAQRITREDGSVEANPFQHVTSQMELDMREVEEMSIGDLLDKVRTTAHDMARQQSMIIIEGFNEATARAGNSIDAGGQPLTHDLLLQVFRQIDIDFDENGQPKMPSLVIGPALEERAHALMAEAENNHEQKQAFDTLIEEKRREWLDRESSRKLVG